MSYTLVFKASLGTSHAGLTDLRAQLVDGSNNAVGGVVTTGFSEIGGGDYWWQGSIPNGHQGGVKLYSAATPSLFATCDINPQLNEPNAEPTGAPPTTASLATMIAFLYEALRNGLTVTADTKTFLNGSSASQWSKPLADDGTTYSEGKGV